MSASVLLLVTWLVSGEAPANYQVPFANMALCEEAKAKVAAERDKLVADEADYVAEAKKQGKVEAPRSINVTANCSLQDQVPPPPPGQTPPPPAPPGNR